MCDNFANLIDLSENENDLNGTPPPTITLMPSTTTIPSTASAPFGSCLISPLLQGRVSLDNNPFDTVQKLVNRPDDPFESVEKEACFKARKHPTLSPIEVKLGNLLSLSDDNLLDNDDDTSNSENTPTETNMPKFGNDTTMGSGGSTIYHSAISNHLDSESPPISMSIKSTPESGGHSASESGGGSASSTDCGTISAKTKKDLELRKRLLKLSITNSNSFNSPVSRRMALPVDGSTDVDKCSPMTALFSEAALCSEYMLAAESPLKLVDDDLISEEKPNFIDSEKDFDADLEMLRIPMLKQLPSPVMTECPFPFPAQAKKSGVASAEKSSTVAATLCDLDAIRAKLRAKRAEANNNQDISLLIQNLRSLICDNEVVDDTKKCHASSLLESLSSALSSGADKRDEPTKDIEDHSTAPTTVATPPPIVRQGTFDIKLQENLEREKQAHSTTASTVVGEISHMTLSTLSTHSVQSNLAYEEMPAAMICSSATYDGETAEDKVDLILPEVEPLPQPPQPCSTMQPDVNDIMEQLSRLLEQHHFTQQQMHNDVSDGVTGATAVTNATSALNPTFIVVMNTSAAATQQVPSAKERSAYVAKYMENSFTVGCSPDLPNSSTMMRRRSQSLSLHDKVKIVQLQMPPPSSLSQVESEVSPPVLTPPMDTDAPEFKTPSRMMMRRNSYSSGTPYTPRTSSNVGLAARTRTISGSETVSKTALHMRRTSVLETHHERQQQAIVRPMPMPHAANMNSFRPDLKKKCKSSSATESIMKSTAPLKATIPVKKVAPMLKTSPPTPEPSHASSSHRNNLNSSMQMSTRSGRMSYTSTPMPLSRSSGALSASTGYPNACSTPTVHHSPMRRSNTGMSKPRYSYLSATPNPKPVTTSAATAGLKRRTLTELRAKSPIKPRVSGIGSATGKPTTRTSLRLPSPSVPRTPNKATTMASGRMSTRTSMGGGSTITYKNKENKKP